MALADRIQNLTPRQRIAAGSAAAVITLAGAVTSVFEGTVYRTYPDPVLGWKVPTACTGHTGPELHAGQRFTQAQCDEMQSADLRKTYDGILSCVGDIPMPDRELTAWLSFAFNVGPAAFCKSSIPAKLKAGDHAGACATLSLYRFVGGHDCALPEYEHVCGGVVTRRGAERSICEGTL